MTLRNPLAATLVIGLVLSGCTGSDDAGPGGRGGPGGPGGGAGRPVPVRVEIAEEGALQRTLRRTGTLRTDSDVQVAPQVGGRLATLPVQIGDEVRRGDVLATLDGREIARARQEAEAGASVAQASVRTAELDEERARRDLARIEALADDQLVTAQQLDDARTAAESAAASLDLARAQLEQATARLETLRLQEAETRLLAPFDGRVADRHVEAGDTVGAGAPVVRVVGDGPLRARIQVPDRDAVLLAVGTPVTVTVDAFPGEAFDGAIDGISPAVDPDSGTVTVEAAVRDDADKLRPGMFARIEVALPQRDAAVLVPAEAVIDDPESGAPSVYVVTGGTAALTPVVLGASEGGRSEVLDGLDAGAEVVVGGQHLLRDGATVSIPGAAP